MKCKTLGWILIGFSFPLFPESFGTLHEEFKKGNFEFVRHASSRELKANQLQPDPRVLYLFIATEQEWKESEKAIHNFRASGVPPSKFSHQALYQFLERLFVLGEFEALVKWGRIFQKEYKGYPKYYSGLFLLSYGYKELQNKKEAIGCLNEIEQNASDSELIQKSISFRESLKKEEAL